MDACGNQALNIFFIIKTSEQIDPKVYLRVFYLWQIDPTALKSIFMSESEVQDITTDSLQWRIGKIHLRGGGGGRRERKEGNVLFNDALNTFYLRLYGIRHGRGPIR